MSNHLILCSDCLLTIRSKIRDKFDWYEFKKKSLLEDNGRDFRYRMSNVDFKYIIIIFFSFHFYTI